MKRFVRSLRKRKARLVRHVEKAFYPPMRPAGVVLGTQKGGTTALFHYLSQHPDVVPSLQKEIHFFNCDAHYEKGTDYYHSFFEAATPSRASRITLDITPGYLMAGDLVAERLARYNPDLKLLALLREPVSRAFSAWQMFRKMRSINPQWFDQWVHGYRLVGFENMQIRPVFGESFLDDVRFEIDVMDRGGVVDLPLIKHGLYFSCLLSYLQKFPFSQVQVISSEEFRRDTRNSLHAIEAHFGISRHAWQSEQIRPHFEGGYSEPIPADAKQLLADYYRPFNQQLFSLLGREFDWS
ncbi:Sulfotransferase domain-containing protein [Pseudomonas pohangensis]|uniref:Sulfotransferase domain-containing protein n=1 Tax=Pseudomonas pohangensis TaxID=364197 RepID=A0A1H2H9T7_9PSED|nr:sulfotransferase domain-containing protein [Pseudomonas pohangensis]SDU28595.1 Sulfotransferase domain-containing protein [Pseudomonas pohangensis]